MQVKENGVESILIKSINYKLQYCTIHNTLFMIYLANNCNVPMPHHSRFENLGFRV